MYIKSTRLKTLKWSLRRKWRENNEVSFVDLESDGADWIQLTIKILTQEMQNSWDGCQRFSSAYTCEEPWMHVAKHHDF